MATNDKFAGFAVGLDSPYVDGVAVTPNDTTELAEKPRALWIGAAGALALQLKLGTTITLAAVPVGLLKVRPVRVMATGTVASSIVALY